MASGREWADRFVAGLHELVVLGHGGAALGRCYAPSVEFGAYVPGEVVHAHSRDGALAVLERWHGQPGELLHRSSRVFSDQVGSVVGVVADLEWRVPSAADQRAQRTVHRRTHYLHVGEEGVHRHLVFSDHPRSEQRPPEGEPGPVLRGLYASAVRRDAAEPGASGTPIERVEISGGETFFVKWCAPGQDWQGRLTGDTGREAALWTQGWLDRLPDGLSHPIVAAEPFGADMCVTISRDLTPYLLRGRRLSLAEMRGYVSALDAMYAAFKGSGVPDCLASIEQRWGLLWPSAVEREFNQPDQFVKEVARGWDLLDQVVPSDVADVARGIVADPVRVTGGLEPAFLHGDAIPANAAIVGSELVLFDWSLATAGPPEAEAAWLANFAQFYAFGIDELLGLWRSLRDGRHDERALGLCLLGQASGLVPALTCSAVDFPDPVHRRFSRGKLDWWCETVRRYAHLL